MTREETLLIMAMTGVSHQVAQAWKPGSREADVDVVINLTIPVPIGQAEVVKTQKAVTVRAAPTTAGAALGSWKVGKYELWGFFRSSSRDVRDWALLSGNGLTGWCAAQYVRRVA